MPLLNIASDIIERPKMVRCQLPAVKHKKGDFFTKKHFFTNPLKPYPIRGWKNTFPANPSLYMLAVRCQVFSNFGALYGTFGGLDRKKAKSEKRKGQS